MKASTPKPMTMAVKINACGIGSAAPAAPHADPMPQALILTAIVIGFAVVAFTLALFHRGYQTFGSDDPDDLKVSD